MTNTKLHAQRELEILSKSTPDALIIEFTPEILALCEAFGKSGQSGSSAPYVAAAISQSIKKLMMFETIAPLTGDDSEWVDITTKNDTEPIFQNNRDSRVFKNGKDGKAYFIEAIVFDGDIGGTFTGQAVADKDKTIGSAQYIKQFPFIPKTFYVNVIDHRWKDKEQKQLDIDGDWWTHSIKEQKQLDEVFEYYNELIVE